MFHHWISLPCLLIFTQPCPVSSIYFRICDGRTRGRGGAGGKAYSRSWIRIHWANSERVAGRFYCKSCFYWGVYDDNCLVCERVSWLVRPGSKLINKAIKQLAGAGRPNLDKTSPVANSSGFHIYILLLVDMGRWDVISQLPLCSSPLEPLRPRGGQSRLLSLLMAPRVTGMHLRCIFITDSWQWKCTKSMILELHICQIGVKRERVKCSQTDLSKAKLVFLFLYQLRNLY